MAIWNWNDTNILEHPFETSTQYPYYKFGATADEMQKAYQALITKGALSDFSYKVWNDICAKIYELSEKWGSNKSFDNSVCVPSPYLKDYDSENQFNSIADKGVIKATMYNKCANTIPVFSEDMWSNAFENYTANKANNYEFVKKGSICKAIYFLELVNNLNRWSELSAEQITSIILKIVSSIDIRFDMLTIVPISIVQDMLLCVGVNACSLVGVPINIMDNFVYNEKATLLNRESIYISCNKNKFVSHEKTTLALGDYIIFGFEDSFKYNTNADIKLLNLYAITTLINKFCHKEKAFFFLSDVYPFNISDKFSHNEKITLLNRELLPIGINLGIEHSGFLNLEFTQKQKALEHIDSIKLKNNIQLGINSVKDNDLDYRDIIQFTDRANLNGLVPVNMESTDIITFNKRLGLSVDISDIAAHNIHLIIDGEKDLTNAESVNIAHEIGLSVEGKTDVNISDNITMQSENSFGFMDDATYSELPPLKMDYEGSFGEEDNAQMSYANEKNIDAENYQFAVNDGDMALGLSNTNGLDYLGVIDTSDNIQLNIDPTIRLQGNGVFGAINDVLLEESEPIIQLASIITKTITDVQLTPTHIKNLVINNKDIILETDVLLIAKRLLELCSDNDVKVENVAIINSVKLNGLETIVDVTETYSEASIVNRRLSVPVSLNNMINNTYEVNLDKIQPCYIEETNNLTTIKSSGFIDVTHIRKDSLLIQVNISTLETGEVTTVEVDENINAYAKIETLYCGDMDRLESNGGFAESTVSIESEAILVLSKSEQLLASEIENSFVVDLDKILVSDVERHFIYEE